MDEWTLVRVSAFTDCPSCGEPCGHVWFVNVIIDPQTNLPVCINTRTINGDVFLCSETIPTWTPERCHEEASARYLEKFIAACKRPVYRLRDFMAGGAYEEGILQYKKNQARKMKDIGLSALADSKIDMPDVIRWPE